MPSLARHAAFLQVRTDYGPDSVDHSKSKHFTSQHAAEAEGQLNVSAWPRSKESLFANGDTNERYLVSSTDLMYELPRCRALPLQAVGHAPRRYGHAAGNLRAHDTLWAQSTVKNRLRVPSPANGSALTLQQGGARVSRAPHKPSGGQEEAVGGAG